MPTFLRMVLLSDPKAILQSLRQMGLTTPSNERWILAIDVQRGLSVHRQSVTGVAWWLEGLGASKEQQGDPMVELRAALAGNGVTEAGASCREISMSY